MLLGKHGHEVTSCSQNGNVIEVMGGTILDSLESRLILLVKGIYTVTDVHTVVHAPQTRDHALISWPKKSTRELVHVFTKH